MASAANINDVLDGHVALEVQCVDRLYLNAYVPNLQVGGQVVRFITQHLGQPIPSAAVLGAIGNRFRNEVKRFADAHEIPILSSGSLTGRAGMTASSTTYARTWRPPSASAASGSWRSWPARSSSGSSAPATARTTPKAVV